MSATAQITDDFAALAPRAIDILDAVGRELTRRLKPGLDDPTSPDQLVGSDTSLLAVWTSSSIQHLADLPSSFPDDPDDPRIDDLPQLVLDLYATIAPPVLPSAEQMKAVIDTDNVMMGVRLYDHLCQ